MKNWKLISLLFVFVIGLQTQASVTGSNGGGCGEAPQKTERELEKERQEREKRAPLEMEISLKLNQALRMYGSDVVIVGRMGSDLSDRNFRNPRRLQFTHAGFAVYDQEAGQWYFDHLLNTCGGPSSDLYKQSLLQFFQDSPFDYDTRIIVPTKEVQEKIKFVLDSDLRDNLHHRQYSKIAYPFSTRYQNSNQWLLELIGAAQILAEEDLHPTQINRNNVQHFLHDNGYVPTTAILGALEGFFGAGLGIGTGDGTNTHFDDQPRRYKPQFVSVESIELYLKRAQALETSLTICLGTNVGESCR